MTQPNHTMSDAELDEQLGQYLVQDQKDMPRPSDDLMARILADAEAYQPRPTVFAAAPNRPWWKTLFDEIGGWPSLAGLGTAAVIGVWIGLGSSVIVTDGLSSFNLATSASVTATDEVDPFSGLDLGFIEG